MFEFPEGGTEDDKNRWAAEEIEQWEGARFCPVCGEQMKEIHTGYWWCHYCDDDPDIYYGEDSRDEEDEDAYDPDECPNCEGTGYVIIGFDNDPEVYENIEVMCLRCQGTGRGSAS